MYQFIGREKEAWTNISKSFSRITSSLQRTGIEKPTLHNFTWILVHKHMFGMRLRGHGAIQTDMKTIQKHVIKRFSNISGRSCFNRLRRFAVIIWIFSTTWSTWYYGHGFLFLLLQSSTVLTHLFSRGIILTYSVLRGGEILSIVGAYSHCITFLFQNHYENRREYSSEIDTKGNVVLKERSHTRNGCLILSHPDLNELYKQHYNCDRDLFIMRLVNKCFCSINIIPKRIVDQCSHVENPCISHFLLYYPLKERDCIFLNG